MDKMATSCDQLDWVVLLMKTFAHQVVHSPVAEVFQRTIFVFAYYATLMTLLHFFLLLLYSFHQQVQHV